MNSSEDGTNRTVITEPIHDLYLRLLIRTLEMDTSNRSAVPITLSTSSGVVYGQLISRDSWKERWVESMRTAVGEGAELLRDFPSTVDKAIDQVFAEEGVESAEDSILRYFIHLKDVTLFVPGAGRVGAPIWRGRLDSVTGWSLGTPN